MKFFLVIIVLAFSLVVNAQSHTHHTKHNMVMYGESEVFLSHIVYKVPHNYQVILRIRISSEILHKYLEAKKSASQMIFLFDKMNISEIANASFIKGIIYSEDSEGVRTQIETDVKIEKQDFDIIYFNELPLVLSQE
jgi:hypothetical protein